MGVVNFGVPEPEMRWLKKKLKLTTAVEGGTYKGGTALRLCTQFAKVYTIEKSDVMFEKAKKNIGNIQNITQLIGDTRTHLPVIASQADNILFWLDAHWSGGETYGDEDECPLLQEMDIIFRSSVKNYAILIDDARLFLSPPPLPHQVENWPSIKQIADIIPSNFDMIVHDDVIYIVPIEIAMPRYIQEKTTAAWLKSEAISRSTLVSRFRSLFSSIVGKIKRTTIRTKRKDD
jgi:hypothetical protein